MAMASLMTARMLTAMDVLMSMKIKTTTVNWMVTGCALRSAGHSTTTLFLALILPMSMVMVSLMMRTHYQMTTGSGLTRTLTV